MLFSDRGSVLKRSLLLIPRASIAVLMMAGTGCGIFPEVRFVPKPQPEVQVRSDALDQQAMDTRREGKNSSNLNREESSDAVDVSVPNPYLQSRRRVSSSTENIFQQSVLAMQQKNWNVAESKLIHLVEHNPGLSGPLLNLGLVYRATDRLPLAVKTIQTAIDANPKNLDAYNQLAIIKREQGLFIEAESLYLQALRIWPQHATSHRNLGILYELYMGKFERALYHYEKCQLLMPEADKQLAGWIFDLKRRLQQVANADAR